MLGCVGCVQASVGVSVNAEDANDGEDWPAAGGTSLDKGNVIHYGTSSPGSWVITSSLRVLVFTDYQVQVDKPTLSSRLI
jgi:hypothetical protein